jgi:hypothetical protein
VGMLEVFELKSDIAVCFNDYETKVELSQAATVLLNQGIEYLVDTYLFDVPFGFNPLDTLYIRFDSGLNRIDKLTL